MYPEQTPALVWGGSFLGIQPLDFMNAQAGSGACDGPPAMVRPSQVAKGLDGLEPNRVVAGQVDKTVRGNGL